MEQGVFSIAQYTHIKKPEGIVSLSWLHEGVALQTPRLRPSKSTKGPRHPASQPSASTLNLKKLRNPKPSARNPNELEALLHP